MPPSIQTAAGDSLQQPCPWDDLGADAAGLAVSDFLTTVVIQAGNALRRGLTVPYASQFGVTVPEWRMLSVLSEAGELAFADLVLRSATDKAQVSRTLRQLEARGLLVIRGEGRKLVCAISPDGRSLYDRVMPVARQRQADMLALLSPEERRALYGAMKKLRDACGASADPAVE